MATVKLTETATRGHRAVSLWDTARVRAWLVTQVKTIPPGEVLIVTDTRRRIVAASASVQAVLGYGAADLVGRSIGVLQAAPRDRTVGAVAMHRFLELRRMAGSHPIRAASGEVGLFDYDAHADRPADGFHLTRLTRRLRHTPPRVVSGGELDVLRLARAGLSDEAIGAALGVTSGMVRNRRHHAYQKLHVSHLADACAVLHLGAQTEHRHR